MSVRKLLAVAAFSCAGLSSLPKPTLANPYDDCILQNMGTAQNQAAVYAIERACISKTSVSIPPDDKFAGGLSAVAGDFNLGSFGGPTYGLVVTMKNTTSYYITEVAISIENRDTNAVSQYPVSVFTGPLPAGTIVTALAEPAFSQMIKPGSTIRFFVHIDEASAKRSDFWNNTKTR